MARMPARAYREAFARWTAAEVASNTTSGNGSWASSQSTPPALAARPLPAARRSPGLSGSMPTIQRGSISGERNSLCSRSVPMLPDPTMAAVRLATRHLRERQADLAQAGEDGPELIARMCVHRPGAGTRQHQVPGPKPDAEAGDGPGEPGDRGRRVAEHRVRAPLGNRHAAPVERRLDIADVH